jgi:hypothetical protein
MPTGSNFPCCTRRWNFPRVAHYLKFDFFPAVNILFYKDLTDGRHFKARAGDRGKLPGIVGHASACAAQCKGGPDYNRVAYALGHPKRRFNVICYIRGYDRLAYPSHCLLEKLPILGLVYGFGVGANQPYAVLFKKALAGQPHG